MMTTEYKPTRDCDSDTDIMQSMYETTIQELIDSNNMWKMRYETAMKEQQEMCRAIRDMAERIALLEHIARVRGCTLPPPLVRMTNSPFDPNYYCKGDEKV